ncbi:hypothetical protein BELINDA_210 [Bacillus phage Belinda]|uniref:hypothetical protein n=1 Tax=Bacillus phage Belinda TaxID=1852564 RepID=UPI0007F08BF9|nr:hypothetical protein BI039_gp168 [Bacillus phage Belinda]ANM46136.1 hypothetical protein BELINDA_210 [Bacillus phage Belinda]
MIDNINKSELVKGISDIDFSYYDENEDDGADFPAGEPFYIVGKIKTSHYMGNEAYIIMNDGDNTLTVAAFLVKLYEGEEE